MELCDLTLWVSGGAGHFNLARALVGGAESGAIPATQNMVAATTEPEKQGKVMGLLFVGSAFGMILALSFGVSAGFAALSVGAISDRLVQDRSNRSGKRGRFDAFGQCAVFDCLIHGRKSRFIYWVEYLRLPFDGQFCGALVQYGAKCCTYCFASSRVSRGFDGGTLFGQSVSAPVRGALSDFFLTLSGCMVSCAPEKADALVSLAGVWAAWHFFAAARHIRRAS